MRAIRCNVSPLVILCGVVIIMLLYPTTASCSECADFKSFYVPSFELGFWTWTFIIVGAIAAGAIVFFTAGSASGPVAIVGGWIGGMMGLSGAAATSAGLALLGGGSVAAGGLGIAGGAAFLTAVFTFGTDVAISYSAEAALVAWQQSAFINDSKQMLTLPLPINKKGGVAYKKTLEYLKKEYDVKQDIRTEKNQDVLRKAIEILLNNISAEKEIDWKTKDQALLATLYFQVGNYTEAMKAAQCSIDLGKEGKKRTTMPSFIYATSSLYNKNVDIKTIQRDYLKYSIIAEPDNKLIPLLYAIYLDRLMYLYHYEKAGKDDLAELVLIATEAPVKKISPEILTILAGRFLVEIKRTQQDIYIICKNKDNPDILYNSRTIDVLEERYRSHDELVKIMKSQLLPEISKRNADIPKDSAVRIEKLEPLVNDYDSELIHLKDSIKEFSKNRPGWFSRQLHRI